MKKRLRERMVEFIDEILFVGVNLLMLKETWESIKIKAN